jgi:uncharacterized membrane protein YebE (DUF533 family)
MIDPKKLLNDFLGTQVPGTQGTVREKASEAVDMAKKNPLATGAILAVLLGTGAGRSVTGSAVQLGGLAAIGAIGYKAWQNYKAGKAPTDAANAGSASEPVLIEAPRDTGFHPDDAPQGDVEWAMVLIRAMIAAARADGHIDADERTRIIDKLAVSGLNSDASAFIAQELANPVDLDALTVAAKTDAQKVELYTASRLTIDPKTRAERGYLDMLAGRLALPDALIDHIEATVATASV